MADIQRIIEVYYQATQDPEYNQGAWCSCFAHKTVQLFGTKAEKSDYSNRVNRIDEGKFSLIATPSVVAQKLLEVTNIEASNLFQKPYTLEDVKQAINEMIQVRSDLTEEIRNFITEDETDVTV